MSVQLEDIKYFITTAETLNITRASEQLGITQPTLSYAIKRLEQEMGGELFIRLKNGVQLSHLGTHFLAKARELIKTWEELHKVKNEFDHVVSGNFTIGLHPSVALYTLDKFLPRLIQNSPLLEINLIHGLSREITEQVISWKVDFGIVVNPKAHPDLVINELCKDEVSLYMKKGISNHSFDTLIYDKNLVQSKKILSKLKKKLSNKHLTSENLEVIAKLTSLGLGIGLLPERVANQYKNLVKIKDAPTHTDKVCLIYRFEKQKNFSSKSIISTITNATY